jgi:hypothetical protein
MQKITISDDEILSLWRTPSPSMGLNDVMTFHDYDADREKPRPELRRLVELAMEFAQKLVEPFEIDDIEIMRIWRMAEPAPEQAAEMSWNDGGDDDFPVWELRRLVELAMEFARERRAEAGRCISKKHCRFFMEPGQAEECLIPAEMLKALDSCVGLTEVEMLEPGQAEECLIPAEMLTALDSCVGLTEVEMLEPGEVKAELAADPNCTLLGVLAKLRERAKAYRRILEADKLWGRSADMEALLCLSELDAIIGIVQEAAHVEPECTPEFDYSEEYERVSEAARQAERQS